MTSKKSSNLLKIPRLVGGSVGIQTQICLTPKPTHLTTRLSSPNPETVHDSLWLPLRETCSCDHLRLCWGAPRAQDEFYLIRCKDSPESLAHEINFRGCQIPASLWGAAHIYLGSDREVAVNPGHSLRPPLSGHLSSSY